MKFIDPKLTFYTVELSSDELLGIMKVIGVTSRNQRIKDMKCTPAESIAVEEVYKKISEKFINDDC